MTSFWEILKASKGLSHEPFACLAAQSMTGGKVAELSGIPPLSFQSNGEPLVEYQIYGKTVQNGTPTPDAPIEVQGVGDLVESGEHAGQYAVPISTNGTTTTIYLDSPLYGTGDVLDEYDSTGKIVRKWGVKVFDGSENWNSHPTRSGSFYRNMGIKLPDNYAILCTHGITVNTSSDYAYGKVLVERSGNSSYFNFWFLTDTTDVNDFKSYLAAQYAAGTPVAVIYPLATPTEESISAPQINTVKGVNTLTVDTAVQPSNVSIKYKV